MLVARRLRNTPARQANWSPPMGKSRTGQDFRDASRVKAGNAPAPCSTDQACGPQDRLTDDLLARRTPLPARVGDGSHPLGNDRAIVAGAFRRACRGAAENASAGARRGGNGTGKRSVAGPPDGSRARVAASRAPARDLG